LTLKREKKTLCRCAAEFTARLEFGSVLRKFRAHGRAGVNNCHAPLHAG
jgi:hypothetical protein